MKSPETANSPLEQVYTLTLLADEAAQSGATPELVRLLDRRGLAIDALEGYALTSADNATLVRISVIDAQMVRRLEQVRCDSLAAIIDMGRTRSGLASYRKQTG